MSMLRCPLRLKAEAPLSARGGYATNDPNSIGKTMGVTWAPWLRRAVVGFAPRRDLASISLVEARPILGIVPWDQLEANSCRASVWAGRVCRNTHARIVLRESEPFVKGLLRQTFRGLVGIPVLHKYARNQRPFWRIVRQLVRRSRSWPSSY
jgi:hypothetical protein